MDVLTGVVLIVAGGSAARIGRSRAAGLLMVTSGATWFIGNLAVVDVAWIASVASQLRFVHRGFLAGAMLAPARRATHRLLNVGLLCATFSTSWMGAPLGIALWAIAVAVALFVRRLRGITLVPGILLATTMFLVAWRLCVTVASPWNVTMYEVGMMATAVGLCVVARGGRLERRVGDAVIDILGGPGRTVRRLVAEALGDADADVAFAVDGAWVDELGRSRGALVVANGTSVIDVVTDGLIVAQVSCASELASRPGVVAAVERATSLVAENARLRAHAVAEAVELDASRRRLVVAAGEQRIRLSAELHAATEPLLSAIEEVLDELGRSEDRQSADIVALSRQRVRLLRSDVHALASGLGPAQLANGDLGSALRSLVTATGIPCSVTIDAFDLPSDVSTVLYFVAAEAVSNAVKHADAEHLWLSLTDFGVGVRLEVGDDGVGGADAGRGSGLRGLADRVATFGGVLELRSGRGEGTVVTVVVPITGDAV